MGSVLPGRMVFIDHLSKKRSVSGFDAFSSREPEATSLENALTLQMQRHLRWSPRKPNQFNTARPYFLA
jgi:hypothetical protein